MGRTKKLNESNLIEIIKTSQKNFKQNRYLNSPIQKNIGKASETESDIDSDEDIDGIKAKLIL